MALLISSTCEKCGKRWSYTACGKAIPLCSECQRIAEAEKRAKEPVPDARPSKLKESYDALPEEAQRRVMDHLAAWIKNNGQMSLSRNDPHKRAVVAIFWDNGCEMEEEC